MTPAQITAALEEFRLWTCRFTADGFDILRGDDLKLHAGIATAEFRNGDLIAGYFEPYRMTAALEAAERAGWVKAADYEGPDRALVYGTPDGEVLGRHDHPAMAVCKLENCWTVESTDAYTVQMVDITHVRPLPEAP